MRATRVIAVITVILSVAGLADAADPGYDLTKLPEGSVWNGTFNVINGNKVTYSTGLEIKITKREKTKFEGEWTMDASATRLKIEGTISGNKLSFKFTKVLEGKPPPDVIGNAKASGTLTTRDDRPAIQDGTYVVPGRGTTGKWEVKLAGE